MREEDIYKNHKLIAEFMGFKYYPFNEGSGKDPGWKNHPDASSMRKHNDAHNLFAGNVKWSIHDGEVFETKGHGEKWEYLCRHHRGLNYDTDWNWTMRVVEKIEEMGYGFTVDPWGITIIDYTTGLEEVIVEFINDDNHGKHSQYFTVIVEFINWYNKNNQIK